MMEALRLNNRNFFLPLLPLKFPNEVARYGYGMVLERPGKLFAGGL